MTGEWPSALLRDLIEFTRDGEWGSEQPTANSVEMRVVRGTDFGRLRVGALREIPRRHIERGAAERKQLRAGDVLIETAGGTRDQSTGRTALVSQSHLDRAGLPVTCSSFARFLRFDRAHIDPRFMYWWLQGLHASGQMEIHQVQHTGVARFQFTKFIESTEAPVPPLAEQRAIAHILGTLDDKIELNRRTDETLEAITRALFKSWFVDFDPVRAKAEGRDPSLPKPLANLFPDRLEDSELGEIPVGWEVGTLADFASLNPESWAKDTRPDVINYVDLSNTKWGRIEVVTAYAQQDAPSRAQRVLRPRDTIVGTVRPGNGSYASISEDGLTGSTGFAVLRPRRVEDAEFIYISATGAENIEALSHLADGGAYPAVRPEIVIATQVIRPGDKLLARFSGITGPLLAKIAQNDRESRILGALRDTLLLKLISGELRVRDAERFIGRATP